MLSGRVVLGGLTLSTASFHACNDRCSPLISPSSVPQHVDLFDAPFFRMSRGEAAALDPQTRVLLTVAHEAFADAGSAYSATDLAPDTGTYVGCMFGDYASLLRVALQQAHTGPVMTGGFWSFLGADQCGWGHGMHRQLLPTPTVHLSP